jgi:Arc/MetJ-type ribon-helix-helix transcriptional regulator
MPQLSRTGVSLDEDLLKEFDRLITKRGYQNRSEAFRDLIREALLTESIDSNKRVVGTLTLVYDHHGAESLPEADRDTTRSRNNGPGGHTRPSGPPLLPGSHPYEGAKQGYPGNRRPYAGPSRRGTGEAGTDELGQRPQKPRPYLLALTPKIEFCDGSWSKGSF